MVILASAMLALIGIGVLGLIYAFSPINPFDGKGPSAGFGGIFFAVGSSGLVLVGLIALATIGVAQVFFA